MPQVVASVFEHQTVRVGADARADGEAAFRLSAADFDALARFSDTSAHRYFELGHRSVKFTQWVGYVKVGGIAFEILPKADRSTRAGGTRRWRNALLEMLRIAYDSSIATPATAPQALAPSSVVSVVASAFLSQVEKLTRDGLARGYRRDRANASLFRGRLLVAENIRANVARRDRFFTEFATYDHDMVVNRVLREALLALERLPLSPSLLATAAHAKALLGDLTPLQVSAQLFQRLHLDRMTSRYASALTLARMILESQNPALRSGRTDVFAMLFDMNELWEKFVIAIFRRACPPEYETRSQEGRRFWSVPSECAAHVRPDLVIRHRATGRTALIADTKWKVLARARPSDDDLKQMFVYNELFGAPRAVLVYPDCEQAAEVVAGTYESREHSCSTATLGLFEGDAVRTAAMVRAAQALLAGLISFPDVRAGRSR